MDRLAILLVVLAATWAFAAWWRARDGRVIGTATVTAGSGGRWAGLPVTAADVAVVVSPSTPLTLVEFTAPNCSPCAQTRALLDEVAASRPELTVRSVDVADTLDLVRAHRIMRAPTTLLISADGHLLGRVAGVPRRDQLEALVDGTRQRLSA